MRDPSRRLQAALLALIALGIALRLWSALHVPALWLDEVISARFAESPLRDLLLAVPRFDTHPPLYYLQLHLWARFGSGDSWLLLNSVLLDLAVMLSLAVLVTRLFDRRAGAWAAAIWAVLPLAVFFAGNLRMYPLTYLLSVWLWYLLERRARGELAGGGRRLGVIATGIALTMTHGMGFFIAFFLWLQAVARAWQARRAGRVAEPGRIFVDYLPVALCALYPLGISLFRQTEGLASFDLGVIGIHLTIALFGMEAPVPMLAGYLGALLLLVPPLLDARARPVLLWLALLPWAVLLGLSLGVKTVFMYRTIGLFLPFLAIALGLFLAGLWAPGNRRGQALAVLVPVLLGAAAINSTLSFHKAGYRNIAAIWQQQAPPGAVLFVDGPGDLWGISRYLAGAPGYSALAVQPPVRDGMLRLKQRLAGGWFERAGLFGQTDHLVLEGRQIWPYVPHDWPPGLALYWVMSDRDAGCLRDGDSIRRSFAADGHRLVECGAAAAD